MHLLASKRSPASLKHGWKEPLNVFIKLCFFFHSYWKVIMYACSRHHPNEERLCTSGQLEHNKRNFISTSNHVFFVYHINTKALYWQEKSPLLMNENKRIDNPWIRVVKCVDALKMKTCLEWLQKQTLGLISNIKKIHCYWIGPYRQKKSFRYTDRGKSSNLWFSFASKSSSSSFVSVCTAFVHWNLSPR